MWSTRIAHNWMLMVSIIFVVNGDEECGDEAGCCMVNQNEYEMNCSDEGLKLSNCSIFKLSNFKVNNRESCRNFSVDLSNNTLEDFNAIVAALSKFKGINLSFNKISTFTPKTTMEVENLNISHTAATSVNFKNALRKLKYLDASYNELGFINCSIGLKALNVSHNRFNIKLDPDCFSESLEYLDLSHSSRPSIPNLQNTSLKTVILSNASIEDASIFSNIEPLEFLDLSHNTISDISNLNLTSKVHFLNLSYNWIVKIEAFMANLLTTAVENATRTIDLRYNPIDETELNEIADRATNVSKSDDCSCANLTYDTFVLLFCLRSDLSGKCLIEERVETELTTITVPSTGKPAKIIANDSGTNNTNSQEAPPLAAVNQTTINITSQLSHASYFILSLGAAKLSFLGFLLFTLMVLIVINYIVGDPVVDDCWWEEKQPGDRPVT